MFLLQFCKILDKSAIGTQIRESSLLFPVIEGIHVLALAFSVGLILISDLRLIGVVLRKRSASEVWEQFFPWMTSGFVVMFITGFLLFWSHALAAYNSIAFRTKLALLIGTIVILSLRLLGVMMTGQPVPELTRELANYTASGFALMLSSGVLMFVATAVRNYSNTSFWVKMAFLAAALTFHFAYFRKVIRTEDSGSARWRGKLAAWGALILWFGVGVSGRSIGFLG